MLIVMSLPINFSLTDEQVDDLMEHYETNKLTDVKSELRSDVDDLVKGKINDE